MLNTIESISNLMRGSFLEGIEIHQLPIDQSDECAFEIGVPRARALDAWLLLRSHLQDTKRYPLITEGWGYSDHFSRFPYELEGQTGKLQGVSPEEIIAIAPTANLEAFLKKEKIASQEYLEDHVNFSLEVTKDRFGRCPDSSQIRALIDNRTIQSSIDLEKWLLDWELQNFKYADAVAPPDTRYLEWYEPDGETAPLLLLPIENGWDSLAYLHWFGACSAGTTVAISFLKNWYQKYQAELVCHYGTMLQLNVGRRPATLEDAFELAMQQETLAQCTIILPGICLRDHARSLMVVDRWFLHERP
jgi:Domain of unknown function (DUF4253)